MHVTVIGAGLAGSEAAWQLAQRGIDVTLREMKPEKKTPAHETEYFAELCCSNSLRSDQLENAVGLLKEELRRLGSLILQCADATRVEAGGALAVDRHGFARMVTEQIRSHPRITVVPGEVTEIPEGEVVIASGPLTSDALAERLQALLGADTALHFYDAAAPLVTAESVDMDKAWFGSRYDRGTADYVNCPMTEEEYQSEVETLSADVSTAMSSMSGLSATDEDSFRAGIQSIRDMVSAFRDFAAITNPPESYAEAHAKIAEGCNGFADGLEGLCDSAEGMLDGEMTTEDYNTAVTDYTTALNDAATLLTEGFSMIQE